MFVLYSYSVGGEPAECRTGFGTLERRANHDDASSAAHQTVPGIPEALGNDAAIPRTQNFLFFGLATAFVSLPALRFPGLPGLRSFGWLFLTLRALCFPGPLALRFFGVATLFLSVATLFLGLPALRFFGVAT